MHPQDNTTPQHRPADIDRAAPATPEFANTVLLVGDLDAVLDLLAHVPCDEHPLLEGRFEGEPFRALLSDYYDLFGSLAPLDDDSPAATVQAWGVPRDVDTVTVGRNRSGLFELCFHTEQGPPVEALKTISERFPHMGFAMFSTSLEARCAFISAFLDGESRLRYVGLI